MGMQTGIYGKLAGPGGGVPSVPVRSMGAANAGYASGGTSSYPVTGFPLSAYLGNNRRAAQSSGTPSVVSSSLGNIQQLSSKHVILFIAAFVVAGYFLWHMDNKR